MKMKWFKWLFCMLAAVFTVCIAAGVASYARTVQVQEVSLYASRAEKTEPIKEDKALLYAAKIIPLAGEAASDGSSGPIVTGQEVQAAEKDPIWYVSYVASYGADSAPDDGSVGLYKDGWFVAHSHLWGGEMIASQPEYVAVDGIVYERDYSKIIGEQEYPGMEDEIHAGGGIMFQTCAGPDTNLLVFYKPVQWRMSEQ